MSKLYIYGGITLGGIIGAYLPVLIFHVNPLGVWSIVFGTLGSFTGLYLGYKAYQNYEE
jgi:hypothetical protein